MISQQEKSPKKTRSLLQVVMCIMILLALLQVLVFGTMLVLTDALSYMRQYSYSLLLEKTENRKSYVENMLNQKTDLVYEAACLVGEKSRAVWEEQGASPAALRTDRELVQEILSESAEGLVELIRRDAVNDAFLILDTGELYDSDERQFRAGLYLRDTDVGENSISDNQDIFMEMGSSKIARELGVTLDFEWSLHLDVTDRESGNVDFFLVPLETPVREDGAPLYELGYWSSLTSISKTQQGSIRYTLPLIADDGTVYGVIGVGLLEKTIQQLIPSSDFFNDSTCYVLGTDLEGAGQYTPVLHRGVIYSRLVDSSTVLSRERETGNSIYLFASPDGTDSAGCIQELNLYGSGSPYRDQKWAFISVADRDLLLSMYYTVIRFFLFSGLIALAFSVLFAFITSSSISGPVARMVQQLAYSGRHHERVQFSSSHIAEIDRLADSITYLQADVLEYASRVSRIITVSGSRLGVFRYDCGGDVFVGESLARLLGFPGGVDGDRIVSEEEFREQLRRVDPEDTILSMPIFQQTSGRNETGSRELKHVDEEGTETWYRFSLTRDKDSVLGLVQDITDTTAKLLEANAALKLACAAAEQANCTKTDFLSRMSHDIRTPMNAIISLTAIAQNHLDDRQKLSDCFEKISTSSQYLLSLINEVLDMSKIEAGKFVLSEEQINLVQLVNSLLEMIRPSVKAKDHTLSVHIGDLEHENVISDSLRIQQVFMNIMSNAVKYTPPGGRIRFSMSEKPTGKENVGCFELLFEDNGKGMSPAFMEKMFTPFEREEDVRVAREQGTGLGMAITYNIVKMLGGDIQVRSAVNQGSTFIVTLCLLLDSTGTDPLSGLRGVRILVVDGDETEGEDVCSILREMGMKSQWAGSGKEAADRVEQALRRGERFQLAILDWALPDMDGAQAARAVCDVSGDQPPMIVCTFDDWAGVEKRDAGADVYLSKPLNRSNLTSVLRFLLGNRQEDTLETLQERDFTGCRVLLVEDNELNTEIACEILDMLHLTVETAGNGQEAVTKFAASPPDWYDLIFMDIQMPVMNGYEATRAIRQLERPDAGTVPIVAMTANAFLEDVQNAEKAGMDGHIAKPLDMEKLGEILDRCLGQKMAAGPASKCD